jgi:hypothetical protein
MCIGEILPEGTACDDDLACTFPDACTNGACQGPAFDADGDAYFAYECGGADCDDTDPHVNPDAHEDGAHPPSCNDGLDNDCDGLTDNQDAGCGP